jgi:hypothetical protein
MNNAPRATPDLRERVRRQLGQPLAASRIAALWRCPLCPPETCALLHVTADTLRCLGACGGAGGAQRVLPQPEPEPLAPLIAWADGLP